MNVVLKLCMAGLTCAAIVAGAVAANANSRPADAGAPAIAKTSGAILLALNPQPLPPGDRDDDDYFAG